MQNEWRQARLDASNKAQSPEAVENERKERERRKQKKMEEKREYQKNTLHVAFTNDPLKGAQIYDAALVRQFGHIQSIPYMNFPETCPDLWPQYQRKILEQRKSPYLKLNLTVSEPGCKLEDPALQYKAMLEESYIRRQSVSSGLDLSSLDDSLGADLLNLRGMPSPPTSPKTDSGKVYTNGKVRPKHLKRYKNSNGVYVYYKQKEKRAKHKPKTLSETSKVNHKAKIFATDEQVNFILDYIIEAIRKKRSVFGHKITNTFDAFAAFDKSGNGQLNAEDFVKAMQRLGSIIPTKVLEGFIYKLDGADGNGFIEYDEFRDAIYNRGERKRNASYKAK
jgi:hypothetical protein